MKYFLGLVALLLFSCQGGGFKGGTANKASDDDVRVNSNEAAPEVTQIPGIDSDEPIVLPEVVLESSDQGLLDGHFDLDTSTALYDFDAGTTDGHVHEYDDKYQLNGADFFDLKDNKLTTLPSVLASGQRFRILIANSTLSPSGVLNLNGAPIRVQDFEKLANLKTVFSIDGTAGGLKLSALNLSFPISALKNGGILATATGCVRDNNAGKNGEYRNGALLIQVVDADNYQLDPNTNTAAEGLLWEASLFWHRDNNCFLYFEFKNGW